MNIILLNSHEGEDYLADLFISSILCWRKCRTFVNYIPPYLFDDYPSPNSLYGRGFTAFCSVPSILKSCNRIEIIDPNLILSLIESQPASEFVIVYTSIWRYCHQVDHYSRNNRAGNLKSVIVLDGEDHQNLHWSASCPVTYYKRELLTEDRNRLPISFRIPATTLPFLLLGKNYIPLKTTLLAPCDPRNKNSYIFPIQSQYYRQYAASFFAATTKKGGWDCMRHYEILANHCVPYFPDIHEKPSGTMSGYPIELQLSANNLFELTVRKSHALGPSFWAEYQIILTSFLEYFYDNCISISYRNLLTENDLFSHKDLT